MFLKFKQTRYNADYCKYAHQRNLTKAKIREAQRNYEKHLVDNLHVNPRSFYSYIKSKQKVKDTIGQLRKDDGSFTESNIEAATILNSYFESNFVFEESTVLLDFATRIPDSIPDIDLNVSNIYQKLSVLNPNKTPGPDNIHPYVLKVCSATLSKPLYLLFKQSLTTGT